MTLNHTIVVAKDKAVSEVFLPELAGLPAPIILGPIAVVRVGETFCPWRHSLSPLCFSGQRGQIRQDL